MTGRLVAVDVETTGLDVDRHVVIEVAAVDVRSGEVFEFVPVLTQAELAESSPAAFAVNRYFERRVFERAGTVPGWPELAGFLGGANDLRGERSLRRGDAAQVVRRARHGR